MYSPSEKPPRILQRGKKVVCQKREGGRRRGTASAALTIIPLLFNVLSFFPLFGQLPFMQIMPFDGGKFLMCSGYNRRIKHRRPGLILLGEKLSSVITSSLHVVGRGVNSGRGLKKNAQSELQ